MSKYIQCLLARTFTPTLLPGAPPGWKAKPACEMRTVGIPSEFATQGSTVSVDGKNWTVEAVYDEIKSPYHDSVRRQHRKNTGDAEPKAPNP